VYLSSGTVRNHLSVIIQKLGARNRVDAVRIAVEKGWLPTGAAARGPLEG
jgi:two-component system, NarL family, response regulator DesR